MKRKLCESGVIDENLFSDLSDEESYISAVDKMENEYLKNKKVRHEENKFTCDVCHKAFKKMQYLIKHKLLHNLVLTCDLCDKKLTRQDNLQRHKRKIHGQLTTKGKCELPPVEVSCDVCQKKFSRRGIYNVTNKRFIKKT